MRLSGIDPAELMSIADTKEAMREADRAAYAEAREWARPATAIEQRIIDCREKAQQLGAEIVPGGSELGDLRNRAWRGGIRGAARSGGDCDCARHAGRRNRPRRVAPRSRHATARRRNQSRGFAPIPAISMM